MGADMKRTALRSVGKRGRARIKAWAKVRDALRARSLGWCEACDVHVLEGCSGLYEHAHHVLPRSQGGRDVLDNALATGWFHHDWIHANPAEAYALGLLKRRGDG